MPRYLLHHEHGPAELRGRVRVFRRPRQPPASTMGSYLFGGHAIWWDVNAASEAEA
jgi:hypothetical protein